MEIKLCNLCRCTVTATYALKNIEQFANMTCEHEIKLANLNTDGSLDILLGQNNINIVIDDDNALKTITGDTLGGSIQLDTGETRISGNVVVFTYPVPFATAPYVLISDVFDNYAMGHTGVFKVSSTTTAMTIAVKTGLSLEPETSYKINYLIKE